MRTRLTGEKKPLRTALTVFVALVVFCLAQLTWWIIFHTKSTSEMRQSELDHFEVEADRSALAANRVFGMVSATGRLFGQAEAPTDQLFEWADGLLRGVTVVGYVVRPSETDTAILVGEVDSTFFAAVDGFGTIYFDPNVPMRLAGFDSTTVSFVPGRSSPGDSDSWVRADMFQLRDEYVDNLKEETRREIVMLVSEASVFALIMFLGAFMIYRGLRRSEDLKMRQTNFIQAATHELHTPITSLRLYLETIKSGNVDQQKVDELLGRMLGDCDRLENLVNNVLEAGHFGRDKYELKLSRTDFSKDVRKYLDGLHPIVDRGGGVLNYEIEDNIFIQSDFQAIGRVFKALADNALKYSPSERKQIDVQLSRQRRFAVLTVADRGYGIPREELKNVFDRFYRVGDEATRSVRGTGLGLYLVRQIIRAHGGSVTVQSDGEDQGSLFTLKFPVAS